MVWATFWATFSQTHLVALTEIQRHSESPSPKGVLRSVYASSGFCVAPCHARLRDKIRTDPICVSWGVVRHGATRFWCSCKQALGWRILRIRLWDSLGLETNLTFVAPICSYSRGCQMVYFLTKIHIYVNFWGPRNGICYGHLVCILTTLVYFVPFGIHFDHFGIFLYNSWYCLAFIPRKIWQPCATEWVRYYSL
jgi:hypothetical protein